MLCDPSLELESRYVSSSSGKESKDIEKPVVVSLVTVLLLHRATPYGLHRSPRGPSRVGQDGMHQ